MKATCRNSQLGLQLIGVYKLAKAVALLIGGSLFLHVQPSTLLAHVSHFVARLRLDPENRLIHLVFSHLLGLDSKQLELAGVVLCLYGLLFATEGVGLLLQKRWAETLVVVTTGLLIPLEAYEFLMKPRVLRGSVLLANVLILAYLIWNLRSIIPQAHQLSPDHEAPLAGDPSDGSPGGGSKLKDSGLDPVDPIPPADDHTASSI